MLYGWVKSLTWSFGARIDQRGARAMAQELLTTYFGDKRESVAVEYRAYQASGGGMTLLPYSDAELQLSALFADLTKGQDIDIARSSLKQYFEEALNNRATDRSRAVTALYGLAALGEPVLISLQNANNDPDMILKDRIILALAFDTMGAKEEARKIYQRHLLPNITVKNSYANIANVRSRDETIELTALTAMLAGSLDEPEALALATYAGDQRAETILVIFEILGYL